MAYLNREAADAAMKRPGKRRWTQQEVADAANISYAQIGRIFTGSRTSVETIGFIEEVLGADTGSLVRPESSLGTILGDEWNVNYMKKVGGDVTAANGLRYQLYEVTSRVHRDRIGRLKRYDTQQLSLRTRKRVEAVLGRHASVAVKLQHLPWIAKHVTSGRDKAAGCHWVLDDKPHGQTYGERTGHEPWQPEQLRRVMKSMAEGLASLHEHDVLLREFNPESIVVETAPERVVFLDYELGKILADVPTVSPERKWRTSAYVATEVAAGGPVTPAADWYVWGMLYLFGLSGGRVSEPADAQKVIEKFHLSPRLGKTILGCLHRLPSNRPDTRSIMRALARG